MSANLKVAILGASRGFGAALVEQLLPIVPEGQLLLSSRKFELLKGLARDGDIVVPADFTFAADQDLLLQNVLDFQPSHLFYVSGGGPHGEFGKKSWKDHQWAYELNLLFPAKLAWSQLSNNRSLHIIFIGSAIADNKPDPLASSYASAKHGLRGLVTSLQNENSAIQFTLFSPGYMDTALLPQGSKPRRDGNVEDPKSVAKRCLKECGLL